MTNELTPEELEIVEACRPKEGDKFLTVVDRVYAAIDKPQHVSEGVHYLQLIEIIQKLCPK